MSPASGVSSPTRTNRGQRLARDPGLLGESDINVPRGEDRRRTGASFAILAHARYDAGMTRSKIAISLPAHQLARVHREVRAGRADSVSGYIAQVLAEHEKRESLRALLSDLTKQYGEPSAEDVKWAKGALEKHRQA